RSSGPRRRPCPIPFLHPCPPPCRLLPTRPAHPSKSRPGADARPPPTGREDVRLNSLRGLIPYLARYRTRLLWGALCLVLTNVVALAAPWVLKKVIDGLTVSVTAEKLGRYAMWIVGIAIVGGIFPHRESST